MSLFYKTKTDRTDILLAKHFYGGNDNDRIKMRNFM